MSFPPWSASARKPHPPNRPARPIPLQPQVIGAASVDCEGCTLPCRFFILRACIEALALPDSPSPKLWPKSKSNCSPRPQPKPAPDGCWPSIITWATSAPSVNSSGRPSPTPTATGSACWSSAPPPVACAPATSGSAGAMNNAAAACPWSSTTVVSCCCPTKPSPIWARVACAWRWTV